MVYIICPDPLPCLTLLLLRLLSCLTPPWPVSWAWSQQRCSSLCATTGDNRVGSTSRQYKQTPERQYMQHSMTGSLFPFLHMHLACAYPTSQPASCDATTTSHASQRTTHFFMVLFLPTKPAVSCTLICAFLAADNSGHFCLIFGTILPTPCAATLPGSCLKTLQS